MSSRSPMWFCHQCHAEMRPLMVPDPVCASCRSSFVEKIEDPHNDPRQFAAAADTLPAGNRDGAGFDDFLIALQTLLNRGMEPTDQHVHRQPPSSRMTFQFGTVPGRPRQTTVTFGNPPTHPSMSEFLRSDPAPFPFDDDTHHPRGGQPIEGHLFAQYLMSLLGQTNHPMMPLFMGGMPDSGRMGDYVFSQDALDQIITQIMESTNSTRPVPATAEVIERLPQEVLLVDSPLLTKDCAVCKDSFQLETEDPEQQVVITLPCNHPFHKNCILPWLKSSGTCPVCRYALVPQPGQQSSSNTNNAPSSSSSPRSSQNTARPRSQSPPSGYQRQSPRSTSDSVPGLGSFASLFGVGGNTRHHHRPSPTSTAQPSSPGQPTSSTSRPRSHSDQSRNGQDRQPHFPGQWTDDMSDLD